MPLDGAHKTLAPIGRLAGRGGWQCDHPRRGRRPARKLTSRPIGWPLAVGRWPISCLSRGHKSLERNLIEICGPFATEGRRRRRRRHFCSLAARRPNPINATGRRELDELDSAEAAVTLIGRAPVGQLAGGGGPPRTPRAAPGRPARPAPPPQRAEWAALDSQDGRPQGLGPLRAEFGARSSRTCARAN